MRFILKLLLLALIIFLLASWFPGVAVAGYRAAIAVALVLAVLNAIVRPILVFLTIPITVLTLGLFLLVINALIILLADALLSGFQVDGFLTALLFSILVSIGTWLLDKLLSRS